jgi:NitT/TauT family transport system substrate-binding protein
MKEISSWKFPNGHYELSEGGEYSNMKKFAVVFLLMILMLVVLTGCGDKNGLIELNVSEPIHSIFYAGQYIAVNEGFFAEEGLKVEITTAQGSDKAMTAILSGTSQIALAGPETTVYVYNQGKSDYAVNFAQLTKRDGSFLVGRKPEADFKWESLKDKTVIGARPGGMPEMVLEYVLKQHGLMPGKDVNVITNIQLDAVAGAFSSGTGDYAALFEPTATMVEKENHGYVVASIGKAGGEVPYTAFSATKSYIEKHPDIIQKFTNAIYKAQLWMEQHDSKEIAEAIKSFFPDTDMDVLTTVVQRYKDQDTWAKDPIMKEEAFMHMQDIIKEAGELDKTAPYDELITVEFAQKAMENIKP